MQLNVEKSEALFRVYASNSKYEWWDIKKVIKKQCEKWNQRKNIGRT